MQVTIIQPKGSAALVEWVDHGCIYRCIVPRDEIGENGSVSQDVLDAGISYGTQWSAVEPEIVTGEMIEQALRRAGIWTFEDLQKHAQAAVGAIQSAYGVTLSSLYTLAKEEVKDHGR